MAEIVLKRFVIVLKTLENTVWRQHAQPSSFKYSPKHNVNNEVIAGGKESERQYSICYFCSLTDFCEIFHWLLIECYKTKKII